MPVSAALNSYPAPTRHQLVAENSYLVATNPTISTGLLNVAAQTAFADTAPNFYIVNNEPAQNGRTMYLDYLKLITTQVATGAVSVQYAVKIDAQLRTFGTDNTLLIVPVSPNSQATNVALPTIKAQNSATVSVLSASSSQARIVSRGVLGGINIAGHTHKLIFGDASIGLGGGIVDTAACPAQSGDCTVPIAIGPQTCCTIYIWMPSSSASLAPEFELGMWFR